MRETLAKDQLGGGAFGGSSDVVVEGEGDALQVVGPGAAADRCRQSGGGMRLKA
ncbi:hypothetical protein AYX13_07101 [Cryptococcus neoformans]|nr:hypothetical protein AYX13_07101 [Cryptococcus neoformans var. grubii]